MSAERQRSRLVSSMVFASLAQDVCLLVANTASGVGSLCTGLSTSFANVAQTFGFLFNDQASKYHDLTGRNFAGRRQPVEVAEDDD